MVSARKRKQHYDHARKQTIVHTPDGPIPEEVLRRRAQRDPDMGAVMGETPDVDVPAHPRGPIRA